MKKLMAAAIAGFGFALAAASAQAQAPQTLNQVKSRGILNCGSNTGLAGFGVPDAQGNWTGLDVEFCRAIAATVFNDPTKVKFIPLSAKDRFTALQSEAVKPLRIAEAPVALECKLAHKYEAGDGPGGGTILVGTVVRVHVKDELYENGKIVTERWNPLGRLAGPDYVRLTDTFVLERPVLP